MSTAHEKAYTVVEHQGRYEVRSGSGRSVMVCADEHSAAHYAGMLNEAFANGYRLGRSEQMSSEE